jgi:hypothetical protein
LRPPTPPGQGVALLRIRMGRGPCRMGFRFRGQCVTKRHTKLAMINLRQRWKCGFSLGVVLGLLGGTAEAGEGSLREAAGSRLLIGAAASAGDLADPRFAALYVKHFNAITAHADMMPARLVDDAGRYDFSKADVVVDFAAKHGLALYGHMLLWQHLSRDWLFKDAAGRPLPRE